MVPQPTDSNVKTLTEIFQNGLEVPSYQRELAWDYEKIESLWNDMFRHSQIKNPKSNEHPFFVGATVVNKNDDAREIVDGQQRASSLTVIASAVRDALVATGFQEDAWKIQKEIIYDYDNERPRLKLLDYGDPQWSNSVAVKPYQDIIAPVDSGILLEADAAEGDNTIRLPTNVTAEWTKKEARKLTIFRDDMKIADVELINPTDFKHSQSLHSATHDVEPLESDLQEGDQVWLSSDSVWNKSISNQNKYEHIGPEAHHFHYMKYRSIYLKIREECEFFILDNHEKGYYARTQSNTKTLNLLPVNEHHLPHLFAENAHDIIGDDVRLSQGAENRIFDIAWDDHPSLLNFKKTTPSHPLVLKGEIRAPGNVPGTPTLNRATTIITKSPPVTLLPHNNTDTARAAILRHLICDTKAVEIEFDKAVFEHMDHFLKTNDRSKLSPLLTLDLVNAFVKKISVNPVAPSPDPYTHNERRDIGRSWQNIWDATYIDQEKNASVSQDFFYNWLMASGRWKRDGDRWQKAETFEGLMKSWEDKLYDDDGHYDVSYLKAQFEEMEKFSKYYCEVLNPEKITGTVGAWFEQKQYLFILKQNTSTKQWVPPYLAMRYSENNGISESDVLEVSNLYLKNSITLIMKHSLFPKIMKNAGIETNSAGYKGNDYYGHITGENSWISEIKNKLKLGITNADKTALGKLPTDIPEPNSPDWNITSTNLEKVGAEADLKMFVFAFESILLGQSNPTSWNELEIEHVLPKNPTRWDRTIWDPTTHEDHLELLGNKCLISKQTNIHVKHSTFAGKKAPFNRRRHRIPPYHRDDCDDPGCNNHYETATTISITATKAKFGIIQYRDWTPKVIKDRTKGVMKQIIKKFDF